ncbi:GNAT family N-acetyltransferase [Actinacidiphila yeochonensis]|uniref:GNAT family N-acetyltransferase n=1 Tax=Actinacidiphila yeochonensis TaxID=89050 RepID=UPI00056BB70E|nr:GNAT family N-acetyltransferase [Actinacidiphila yeochonensis]
MGVKIEIVRSADDEVVAAFGRLLPQLSRNAVPLDREAVGRVIACDANTLLVARVGGPDGSAGEIVGTLTLVLFPLPTGLRAWIEDVVVDETARGHGVGAALTEEAVRLAEEAGARTVDLTSRPSREAANRLYERVGFRVRESNVFRFTSGGPR